MPLPRLSEGLKARIASFYATTTETYWWHDPQYLIICDAIAAEIKDKSDGHSQAQAPGR